MNDESLTPVTTFSMLLAYAIGQRCKQNGIPMGDFYAKTGISQPSWSRLSRGQTRFDIEDLRIIEQKTGFSMESVLSSAKALEAGVKREGIEIVQPYTTQKKSDLAQVGKTVVAVAVLGFIASQLLRK